jgi:cell division protein ZapA
MTTSERLVPVEILGQRYPIRSSLDERYVAQLAHYVDQKMRAAADMAPTEDSVRVAVVAALNIADEFFRWRDEDSTLYRSLIDRTSRIEQMVDEALAS